METRRFQRTNITLHL